MDVGTYNLVCCQRDKNGDFSNKHEVNAFIEIPLENDFVFNMMKKTGVPLIERKDAGIAYALGEAAVNMAYAMNTAELKRPMKDGCLNPREKHAQQILNTMIHSLLDEVSRDHETLYYSVPANAINQETDADYHAKILEAVFNAFEDEHGHTVNAKPINEALALIYAELQSKAYTGVSVSCLLPGTKIYTNRGILNIEDVKEGDEVITHKGRWKKITKVITKNFEGISTNLQIRGYANNTDLYKFVDNHEIYVKKEDNWQWIGCEELQEGDIVGEPIIKNNRTENRPTLTLCERITCSKEWKKTHITVTADIQRLIGYFLGDGSVNESEGCIQFDFASIEKENIQDVQEILLKNFKKDGAITRKGENCTRVKCYSKGMVNWFKNHCYDENKAKKYPWNLSRLIKTDYINLLAGLVRSDGSFSDNHIEFTNTNTNLIILAKQLFSKLGIPTSLSYREPRTHFLMSEGRFIEGKKNEWKVNSGSKLTLVSLMDIIKDLNCNNSGFVDRLFIEDGFCCSVIQKIEHEEYNGIVYDLQVEDDHSFSGPFLTIHNCGAGMVNVCYAIFGAPVFQFSIVNSGDWIDKMAAKATGETPTFINKEKTKLDLTVDPETLVLRAIKAQYEIMIQKTVTEIKKGLEKAGNKVKTDHPVDLVIAGGTSLPNGFDKLFGKILRESNLSIEIGEVIRPSDPLFSVARGCLLAAEAAN